MTNLQESRLSMLFGVKDYQAGYTAITTPLPNYSANSTILLNTIPKIQATAQLQATSKTGIADNKNQLKKSLIVQIADYSRKLGAFAKFTNNLVLAKEIKSNESKLSHLADTTVKDFAQTVYDRAQSNITALSAYGITAATQTSLLASITAYNATIGKPRAGASEKSQYTKQLADLFKVADAALANMDAAVEIVRLTQPVFYKGYKTARKIVETGVGKLSVKGIVTDASTGLPIKGVSLTFTHEGGAAKLKSVALPVKKSAAKGRFTIKSLPAGMYKVIISKNGYVKQEATLAVSDGEMSVLNVGLVRN
jgi:hypothetical protein